MTCRHLFHYASASDTWSVSTCSAKKTPYNPSLVELERFCKPGRYNNCPAYVFPTDSGRLLVGQAAF